MWKNTVIALALVFFGLATLLVFLSQETRQLTGIVRDALTNAPIAQARITIAGRDVTTDEQGLYRVDLPRGKYALTIQADGYDLGREEVTGDELFTRAFTLDLNLEPNRVIVIVRDAESKQALPNIQVMVGEKPVMTNAAGSIELRNVKPGTPLAVILPGYQPLAVAFEGQAELELAPVPIRVNVSVADQYTNQPLTNISVQFDNVSAKTDAQGRATLLRVKPGTQIRAAAPGYESASAPFTQGDVLLALRPNVLDGVVTDAATSQPISGTLVYLGSHIATTNGKGEYHFDNVPSKATLIFKAPGYRKTELTISNVARRDIKLTPFAVKGVHLPFGATPEHFRDVMDLIAKTELNALVLSVKAEKGRIAWDSQVPLAKEIGAPALHGVDLKQIVAQCRALNIYCIARLPVFQDNLLANARPQQAVRYANGALFTETNGQQWLNPYVQENWTYHIALAKEIAALGFDEVQFDYVRFPGRTNGMNWGTDYTEDTRIAAIAGFLARAQKELRPTGVFISADVFGLTTATDDDQQTGQRLRDLGPYVDYLSPMVYPDTWVDAADLLTRGLQIKNCTEANKCPYEVIVNSYKRAAEKTPTKIRLWLQAYSGRGDFGVAQYRLQKKAATDASNLGWMFWSGGGTYDAKTFDVVKP